MPKMLEEKDWDILLKRIKNGKCTPFLGSGACSEKISVIFQIANEWAEEYDYPMEESYDLARVAQFVAAVEDLITPKEEVCKKIKKLSEEVTSIYFETPDEIHGILVIPLSVYITTNYDDFMSQIFRRIESTMGGFQ
jgi:hypothetical protein